MVPPPTDEAGGPTHEAADGIELSIRRSWDAGDMEAAATLAIRSYGPELLGYLHAMLHTTDPDELFSTLCEQLWRHLPSFRWESSVRTWAYVVARNLARGEARAAAGPRGKVEGLRETHASRIAADVRSTTAIHLRTDSKDALQRIRDGLDPDDRTLLILRVDRGMAWRDIVAVLGADGPPGDDPAKAAAGLRKRFERLKERLRREMAELRP
ncbi:MAG: sigma-70 family RNA polymerase sigma factor [Nannocystaceae bacterium]|nr:sigma-70 family RNA polymerase sigma factor [Nannocystaceae bacterium]